MIIEFFPNPNPPAKPVHSVTVYPTMVTNPNAKSEWFRTGPSTIRYWNMTEDEIEKKAQKRNISIDEWIRRDMLIRQRVRESRFRPPILTTVYPKSWDDYVQYGHVIVRGITENYDQFGDDDTWPPNDQPLIHLVETSKDGIMLNTSDPWLSYTKPAEIIDVPN